MKRKDLEFYRSCSIVKFANDEVVKFIVTNFLFFLQASAMWADNYWHLFAVLWIPPILLVTSIDISKYLVPRNFKVKHIKQELLFLDCES